MASPLYDIYDPYGVIRQQAEYGAFGDPRNARLSDLMPEEQQTGLLRSLAARGSSGLAGLGWLLDTPGAIVRGTLSDGPLKGISALWESSDDRVTGRELLRQYGAVGNEDTWGNFAGGLATELALDPLTYLSFGLNAVLGKGAKTGAGLAAQRAGLLEDFDLFARNAKSMGTREAMRKATPRELLEQIADVPARQEATDRFLRFAGSKDQLDAPLARMNRVGLPFMDGGAFDLYGEAVGDYVAKAADKFGDNLKQSAVLGPAALRLQAMFDPNVKGMTDYQQQWDARAMSAAERQAVRKARRRSAEIARETDKALSKYGTSLNDPKVPQNLRYFLEGYDVDESVESIFQIPEMERLKPQYEALRADALQSAKELGLPLNEFYSRVGTELVPRQVLEFDVPQQPTWGKGITPQEKVRNPSMRGRRVADLNENVGRSRRAYTDVAGGTRTLDELAFDGTLQQSLRDGDLDKAMDLLEDWEQRNIGGSLYPWLDAKKADGTFKYKAPELPASHPLVKKREALKADVDAAAVIGDDKRFQSAGLELSKTVKEIAELERAEYRKSLYGDMANLLRSLDPQHAAKKVPLFGRNTFNEISGYGMRRAATEARGDSMLDILIKNADQSAAEEVIGGVNYTAAEALSKLGFDPKTSPGVLAERLGVSNLDNVSFNKKLIDDWSRATNRARSGDDLSPLVKAYDNFTNSFKTLALLWPARYARDAYSGSFAAASKGAFNPIDAYIGTQIRRGNYKYLPSRLRNTPGYEGLTDEQIIDKFLMDAAEQGLGTGTMEDTLQVGASRSQMDELYPGAAKPSWRDIGRRLYKPGRTWWQALNPISGDFSPFAVRGPSGNRNPLLELGDRAAETTDSFNRYGVYLNQIRKGVAPEEARRLADLTQVDYRSATAFENDILKRLIPFYSYTKGIVPYIADQAVNQPAGLMGQSIRAVNRGGAPSEENFVPEYLRQSAAVPLPPNFLGVLGLPEDSNLKRFLTNIDLPFESTVNLLTPGTGNNMLEAAGDTVRKTALNVLGAANPLLKGPAELVTNRQFYSGRELSDLYSVLEQTLGSAGRPIEQIAMNLPGGSRAIGTYRQLTDDRLSPQEKWSKFLVNAFTGLKFQDVDMERTRKLAARNMLNQLLERTPGVRTYENITVPEDVLPTMPEEQRNMYLLYKIVQSEAARNARERKKAQEMANPFAPLGIA